jgi:hypothetical protein
MTTLSTFTPNDAILTHSSVPSFVLALIEPSFDKWDCVGVQLGNLVEVDLHSIELLNSQLGLRAAQYWDRCREFWDAYANGASAGPALLIERRVLSARQTDTRNGRFDLSAHFAAFRETPLLGPLIHEITSAQPDFDNLETLFSPLNITISSEGDETVVIAEIPARQDFETLLGGPHSRGELQRKFQFTVNHAKWRDRRVRRLVAIEIDAIELWPDPAFF